MVDDEDEMRHEKRYMDQMDKRDGVHKELAGNHRRVRRRVYILGFTLRFIVTCTAAKVGMLYRNPIRFKIFPRFGALQFHE